MSGFLKTPNTDFSYMTSQPKLPERSCSISKMANQFNSVQEEMHEESDVEELIARIEMLTKENKALVDSNR